MTDWAELFGPEGPLAASIEGFSTRAEQVQMAQAVAAALRTQDRLIVEAGTGTGKTFAYLVPALLSGKRVLVSTAAKTLQDQLFHRDIPMLSRALGRPVSIALLKGRANYLCWHRLALAEQQAIGRGLPRDLARALDRVRAWSPISERGEIAELEQLSESDPIWSWVTSTRENCLGVECDHFHRCHLVHARRQAQAADVVIVNHHLLMADLVLKEEGFGDLLPTADAVIIDEAHQLPEIAAMFLGFTLSTRQLQSFVRDLTSELALGGAAAQAFQACTRVIEGACADVYESLRSAERIEAAAWPASLIECLERLQATLADCAKRLADETAPGAALNALRRRADEVVSRIALLLDDAAAANVRWAQASMHGVSFHYAPLDVAKPFRALTEGQRAAWIFTSATLAVGESFEHFARRLGLDDARTLRLGSPFDYAAQTLLYIPPHLDAPSSARHTRQVMDAVAPILSASGGRAFLLFTSHRALREAAVLLREKLGPQASYPVLVQGEAPREKLLERFREHGAAVLLGTSSFWEGVDVKGAALCVVVIDKLPFAAPDDPVLKARLEAIERRGGNPFFEEQVPQAVIALKQGVGRLMRDTEDFGVVVLCDQRLRTRGYGRVFLDSLPPMRRAQDLEEVTAFLRTRLTARGHAA